MILTDLDSSKDLITATLGRLVTPKVAHVSKAVDELRDVMTLGRGIFPRQCLARVQYQQHLVQFTSQALTKDHPTSRREAL